MYLKRLTLNGFKSFADRTEFEFGHGITSIVGPNGCGKSNIVDALKWVLGEQSARALRGKLMSDVIFAGSRSRKPAKLAEVRLQFDNSDRMLTPDVDEVVITRQLYRDGTSVYRINDNNCRLRDIRDLFLDTGVGVDAYSVIEQGQVDVLLQANPIERREVFEEAAGISKYKVRRTEAERKLERARNNNLRLNDVIEELERRLRSVKLAAGKARRYVEYDDRLRELRSVFALSEYHQLRQSAAGLKKRTAELGEQLSAGRVELASCDAEAAELQHAMQAADEGIQAAEAEQLELQTELSTLSERIDQWKRRLEEYAAQGEQQGARARDLAEQVAELESRQTTQRMALEACSAEFERSTASINELKSEHAAASASGEQARAELETTRASAFDAARREALLHNEHTNLTQERERLAAQLQMLNNRRRQLETDRAQVGERKTSQAREAEALDEQIDRFRAELRDVETSLEAVEQERRAREEGIARAKESRSAVLSRLDVLEDMERRLEGVNDAARAVLAWRDTPERAGSVLGLVADLIRIDNPHVTLLDAVLNACENNVVVRDAYQFMAELERRDPLPGRVSVVALDRLETASPPIDYSGHAGVIGCVRDWASCERQFEPLADFLLTRTVVVDALERALALASEAPAGYVFVSLEGHTVSSDGRLNFGPHKGVAGLISRKAEIRRLHHQLDEIETGLERDERERAAIARRGSDAELQRQSLLEQIAAAQKQHGEAASMLARLEDETERIGQQISMAGGELASAEQSLRETDEQVARLASQSEALAASRQSMDDRVVELERETESRQQTVRRVSESLTEARIALGRSAEKRAAAGDALERIGVQLASERNEQDAARREAEAVAEKIEATRRDLGEAERRAEQVTAAGEQKQAALLSLREKRQQLRGRVEACGARAREIQGNIDGLEASNNEVMVEAREVDVRIENLVQHVRDELSLDLAALYGDYEHADQDWDAIRNEIEELRGKIERLGNVNLDAITELEELTPRHENLTTQRDDLLESIGRLEALIAELNEESRARFGAAFEAIRGHFRELFRRLFGGGKADIILENPDEPLECGIEIVARPPGKEPQSISLLSGGEKTLTAVALLLAVFKSKPSPFTILDEVDAALDESNIERFNSVVKEFLAHSQFIVITHNKVTMHNADAMYGVTMEEAGVSKRVGVRFEERFEAPSAV